MIPKIIHYCWFGLGKKPKLMRKCIDSWKKFCPDYEIIEWNESNYDITKNKYMYDAYQCKKWGFVPDYARLDIIYHNGGFYLDTDVEIIKPLDDLQHLTGYVGFEMPGIVNLGLGFGAEAGNSVVKKMLDQYDDLSFYNDKGKMNLTPSPYYQTSVLKKYGLKEDNSVQTIKDGFVVFSKEYFNPMNMGTGRIELTEKTYSIHRFAGSWVTKRKKIKAKVLRFARRLLPDKVYERIRRVFKKGKKS